MGWVKAPATGGGTKGGAGAGSGGAAVSAAVTPLQPPMPGNFPGTSGRMAAGGAYLGAGGGDSVGGAENEDGRLALPGG